MHERLTAPHPHTGTRYPEARPTWRLVPCLTAPRGYPEARPTSSLRHLEARPTSSMSVNNAGSLTVERPRSCCANAPGSRVWYPHYYIAAESSTGHHIAVADNDTFREIFASMIL